MEQNNSGKERVQAVPTVEDATQEPRVDSRSSLGEIVSGPLRRVTREDLRGAVPRRMRISRELLDKLAADAESHQPEINEGYWDQPGMAGA